MAKLRIKPDKNKVEQYIKSKHTIKSHKVKNGETNLMFIARLHGVTLEELKSVGVKDG